jgi:hypothetical protein
VDTVGDIDGRDGDHCHKSRQSKCLAIERYPARYSVSLVGGWKVIFGFKVSPTDYELMQLIFITPPWGSLKEPLVLKS